MSARWVGSAGLFGLLAGLALVVPGAPVRAEVRPLVVVGATPIYMGTTAGTRAKEKAIDEGLWEGVVRVARDLLDEERAAEEAARAAEQAAADLIAGLAPDLNFDPNFDFNSDPNSAPNSAPEFVPGFGPGFGPGESGESGVVDPEVIEAPPDPFLEGYGGFEGPISGLPVDPEEEARARLAAEVIKAEKLVRAAQTRRIREALGRQMVPYTKSFRIVEDQGERQALFTDDPDVLTEYVILLEVQVEVERVRARLEEAGLLRPLEAHELTGIRLEIFGLTHYGGYAAVLDLLGSEAVAAEGVFPRHFAPGRVVVQVEGDWDPQQLLARLTAAAPPNLSIEGLDPGVPKVPLGWRADSPGPRGAGKLVLRAGWAPLPPPEPGGE